jgi:hypothetical protein
MTMRSRNLEDLEPQRCVLSPNDPRRLLWDVVLISVISFTGIFLPINWVYISIRSDNEIGILQIGIDALWLFGIFLNFRTGFIGVGGCLVLNPRRIAEKYARSWLAIDLLTSWPVILVPQTRAGRELAKVLYWVKLLRLFRLFPLFSKIRKEYRNAMLLPTKIVVVVFIFANMLASFWRLIRVFENFEEDKLMTSFDIWVSDIYYIFSTLTSVGYGGGFH